MQDFLTALGMAWGNFLFIPCPIKRWDEKLRSKMLTMLPVVGAIVGLLWFLIAILLRVTPIPSPITAFILTVVIYGAAGGMHLDGFMDCCDAIMSRKPLEQKQEILKDSHSGAFAFIGLAILMLGMFAGLWGLVTVKPAWPYFLGLFIIPACSRGISGACVLGFKPMKKSQYSDSLAADKEKSILSIIIKLAIVFIVVLALALIAGKSIKVVEVFLITTAVTAIFTFMTAWASKRSLGGINGDIAGQAICIGELFGVLALSIGTSFLAM